MQHHPETEDIASGWQAIIERDLERAEDSFRAALKADPSHVDAWNGLGAVHFERAELAESLDNYQRALTEAKKLYGGTLPAKLSWDQDRPALRAIHGIGLNHFRSGDLKAAAASFEDELARNPADNGGAKFMLDDIKKKKDLWK